MDGGSKDKNQKSKNAGDKKKPSNNVIIARTNLMIRNKQSQSQRKLLTMKSKI